MLRTSTQQAARVSFTRCVWRWRACWSSDTNSSPSSIFSSIVGVRPGRNKRLRMDSSSWWVATKYSNTLGRSQ